MYTVYLYTVPIVLIKQVGSSMRHIFLYVLIFHDLLLSCCQHISYQNDPAIISIIVSSCSSFNYCVMLQPMVQQPVPSGPQGMMVAPVGRPGAGGPQQPGSGPMNPNQPGQSMCSFNLKLLLTYFKVIQFSHLFCFESSCS